MTIANAKPDLLITGPIGTSMVNAASSAWHDYLTVEAKITAAIAYAVSIGAKYCYVPDSFLPYTATLVTFNTAVKMIREGGNPLWFDIQAYGADPTNGLDTSAAILAAMNGAAAITTGGTVYAGEGTFKVLPGSLLNGPSAIQVPANITFIGAGRARTVIWQNTMPTINTVNNSPNNYDVMTLAGSNIILRNLTLRGGAGVAPALPVAGGSASGQHGLNVNIGGGALVTNILIENVTVEQVQTNCMQVWTNVQQLTCRDLRLTDAGNEGLYVSGQNTGYLSFDGTYAAQCQSFGLDTNAGRIRFKNFTVRNCGNTTIMGNGGGVSVYLSTAAAFNTTFMDTVIFENGECHDCIGYGGVGVTVPLVGEVVQGMSFTDIIATSTDRTKSTSGFTVTNQAGGNLGTIQQATVENVHLVNLPFNTQGCTDWKFIGCDTTNTLALPASDDSSTQGFRFDDTTFGPIKVIGCTAKGWRRNFQWITGTRGVSIGNSAINAVTYGYAISGLTVSFKSIGDTESGSGANGYANSIPLLSKILGSEGNNSDGSNTVMDRDILVLSVPLAVTEAVLVSGVDAAYRGTFQPTLTAARLVGAPLNPTAGQIITYTFIQGGAGGFAITWNGIFKGVTWSNAGNAVNTRSSISWQYDGANWNQYGAQSPWAL